MVKRMTWRLAQRETGSERRKNADKNEGNGRVAQAKAGLNKARGNANGPESKEQGGCRGRGSGEAVVIEGGGSRAHNRRR